MIKRAFKTHSNHTKREGNKLRYIILASHFSSSYTFQMRLKTYVFMGSKLHLIEQKLARVCSYILIRSIPYLLFLLYAVQHCIEQMSHKYTLKGLLLS